MSIQPWSQAITLAEASRGPLSHRLSADEGQRKKLARYLGVDALDSLEAEVTVTPWLDGAEVRGVWQAAIVQTCGVSLDPFPTRLSGEFEVRVVPPGSPNAPAEEGQEVAVDLDAPDPPDVLEAEERIDLAAYVVEHLSLEIDPFPRKPGVAFEPPPEEQPASPFAVLQGLKGRDH